MILMNIRIICGRIKYNVGRLFAFNKLSKIIYGIKTLNLKFNSLIHIYFRSKNLQIVDLSPTIVYTEDVLKEIAISKYVYNNVFFIGEDYSENVINHKKFINKYYLKLVNGGHENDRK